MKIIYSSYFIYLSFQLLNSNNVIGPGNDSLIMQLVNKPHIFQFIFTCICESILENKLMFI